MLTTNSYVSFSLGGDLWVSSLCFCGKWSASHEPSEPYATTKESHQKAIPWGSLKRENSASMAFRGNEGKRRRSSWSIDTCDCLWAVGIFCVNDMRNNTRPTSSSLRVNTWKRDKNQNQSNQKALVYMYTHFSRLACTAFSDGREVALMVDRNSMKFEVQVLCPSAEFVWPVFFSSIQHRWTAFANRF